MARTTKRKRMRLSKDSINIHTKQPVRSCSDLIRKYMEVHDITDVKRAVHELKYYGKAVVYLSDCT